MKSQKSNNKFMSVMLLICTSVFLCGCNSNGKVYDTSSTTSDTYKSEESSDTIMKTETDVNTEKNDISLGEEKETGVKDYSDDTQRETVYAEVNEDLDSNGIMDIVQIIRQNNDCESFIRIFINGEQIFEYKDSDLRIMNVYSFEYLDLDGDDINEIFVSADTDANCRPLMEVLCLKQTDGQWKRMDIPLNGNGHNEFSFKITRGKDEFDFIISSDDIEQEIHFDATPFFEDDERSLDGSIQEYRENNYKMGDEVGFSSGWGIWEARTGTYEGRNCIIAVQGIEGPYNNFLGKINIFFSYNEQGNVEIMNVEYEP